MEKPEVSSNLSPLILVINDEPPLRDFLRVNFKLRGYRVIDVPGNDGVTKIIETKCPDLVILDLMLRAIDGFNLCQKICLHSDSRIIVFNMRGGESDLLKCLDMGVDDYLGKPFGIEELMARVRAVLRHKRFVKTLEKV